MFTKTQPTIILKLFTVLVAVSMLLTACTSVEAATTLPELTATMMPVATALPVATTLPNATQAPTTTSVPTETVAPTAAPETTTIPTPLAAPQISLDMGRLATGMETETVAAVSASANGPYWELLPEYTRVTLQGYPISSHNLKPQIFIYPLKDLGIVNEGAGKVAASLQTLIQSPQEITPMPFMPLFNSRQMFHAQVQYLDFKNGQGLRYLTEFSQGIVRINNSELIYTYQGITRDGNYYVAGVLPLNQASLPADGKITGNEPAEFTSNYLTYLANVAKTLNVQDPNTFTPNLIQLDAMLSSLEIK